MGQFSYFNHIYDSAVHFYFGPGYNLTIEDPKFDSVKEAGYSFVVEKLRQLPDTQEFDCLKNSSASLRPLITSCLGFLRVRELAEHEKKKIQDFKNNPEGKPRRINYSGFPF